MSTIKLIPPKGYDTIKPLRDSANRPIRCAPTPQATDEPSPQSACWVPCGCCPAPDCPTATCEHQEALS